MTSISVSKPIDASQVRITPVDEGALAEFLGGNPDEIFEKWNRWSDQERALRMEAKMQQIREQRFF